MKACRQYETVKTGAPPKKMSLPSDSPQLVPQKSKVLVVDDHEVVRRGVVTLINERTDLEVSGDSSNEADAILAFRQNVPDVLLVDWSLKQRDSGGLIITLLREKPNLRVIVLSIHDELTHADLAIQAGARGYIMKRDAGEKIVEGIHSVLAGAFYLSDRALNSLSQDSLKRVSGKRVAHPNLETQKKAEGTEPLCNWAVSVVVPVYNSRETIQKLCKQLLRELATVEQLQIILVDDGSTDGSGQICAQMRARYPSCVDFLQLSRNFGEHNALMAGIKHATGDYCVLMDDDLQNPPSEVKVLLREAALGFDLVYSRYRNRRHPLYRRLGSKLQNWTACLVLGKPPGLYLSSFKVLSARVIKEVSRFNGPEPYLDALLLRATANISSVECLHEERGGGRSGYTWRKLLGLWLRLFVGFSIWPIRLAGLLSLLLYVRSAFTQNPPLENASAWAERATTLILLVLIGEYVGRIHSLHNAPPQFVIKHRELRTPVDITRVQQEIDTAHRNETH